MVHRATGFNNFAQRLLAVVLSSLLIVFAQGDLYAQAPPPNYAPLEAPELNQLVAPIALYPDALVAQILTASTYPDQVQQADGWVQQNGGMPPDQLGAAANGMPWDPSVKALTAFPSVLDYLTRNINWASALGNAYYNQPGDVMNAVQAMRAQAQEAGAFRSIEHQRVYDSGGQIMIEPTDANTVYVPYYDPWTVYGTPVPAYAGFYVPPPPRGVTLAGALAIGFGVGIGIGLFSHYGWGYHSWSPNWRGGVVVYNRTTYISRSTTVYNRGNFGGYNRGVYERSGPGVPRNFRPPVTSRTAAFHPSPGGGNRPGPRPENRPGPGNVNRPGPRPEYRPAPGAVNRPNPRPENRPAPGNANRPGPRPDNRPAPGEVNRPSPRPDNRPAPGGANYPSPRPENRPAPQPQNRPAPQARPQNTPRPEQGRPPGGRAPEARPAAPHGAPSNAQHGGERPHDKGRDEHH
jgi:hypothetical protein